MVFNEKTYRPQNPTEELEALHGRMQDRQERLGITEPSEHERERIASQEIAAYKQEQPSEVLHPEFQMKSQEVESHAETFSAKAEAGLDELVELLVEKGVRNTLEVVEKLDNPHTSDDFHRFLVQYLSEGMTVQGLKEGSPLFKALHMTLFEVTLPEMANTEQGFAQLVSAMEQFYSGMLSIYERSRLKSYFTLEIAQSHFQHTVVFYVAVPNAKIPLFEKQIMATFPSAQISLHKQDYNPFNESGYAAGSIAKLNKSAALPLKTSESFEQDPLNVILGVFSKLQKEGEGAAIQLVVTPVKDEINKKYQEVLREVKGGTSLNRALEGASMKVAREVAGMAKEMIFGNKKEEEEPMDNEVDQTEVDAISKKISSPIINANIRIVGSAPTQARADEIVSDIESAFNQFTNEPFNSIGFRKVSKKGLQALLHEFSFRLYSEKYAMRLNLKELTSMFHLPVMNTSSSELKQSVMASAPSPMEMQPEGVFLGVNNHRGEERNVYFSPEDRMRHFYVIGQTGTGKTTLLKNMIVQDINNGEGVCYIDPHGTDIEDILGAIPEHRMKDVIYFDPSDIEKPLGLNMLEYDLAHPEQKSFVINEMLSIFNKLFDMKTAGGPMFEQYFRNATALVIEDPETGNTLIDVARVLADKKFRDLKLSRCANPIVVQFWKEIAAKAGGEASLANMVPYITNKFDVFLSNDILRSIVSQEQSSFSFRDVMDNRKVLLVNLAKGRLGDINSSLIGLILVGKIFMAALSRVDALNSKPAEFYLYIDEFQNVTTDSISAILSEARKYRLGLTVAHQFIAQLDDGIRDAVFGNVGSLAAFRVGAEDAEFVESHFSPTFAAADIMKVPNRHAYIKMLVHGSVTKPFNMQTVAPVVGDMNVSAQVKNTSREVYGRDKVVVDQMVAQKYAQFSSLGLQTQKPRAPQEQTPPVQKQVAEPTSQVSQTPQTAPQVAPSEPALGSQPTAGVKESVLTNAATPAPSKDSLPKDFAVTEVLKDVQRPRTHTAVRTNPFPVEHTRDETVAQEPAVSSQAETQTKQPAPLENTVKAQEPVPEERGEIAVPVSPNKPVSEVPAAQPVPPEKHDTPVDDSKTTSPTPAASGVENQKKDEKDVDPYREPI